jgi:NADPH:quinone reductase
MAHRSNALYPFPTPLPFIPGNEVAGTVAALGEGVSSPPVGTPVFALVGNGANGYAQYAVTPAQQVIPIPPGVTFDQAAAIPVAGLTPLLILKEIAQLKPGETVLIQGAAGGVGGYAIQLARILGAGRIIGATSTADKFSTVLESGADRAVDYTASGWADEVRTLTDGRGVDVLLEMNGGDSFGQSLSCLAPFGRLVVYGTASGKPLNFDADSILRFFYNPSLNQSIHVFNLGLWFGLRPAEAGQALGELIGYVASGQVRVRVNHILPLAHAAEAHRMIEQRRTTGKIILKPWLDA